MKTEQLTVKLERSGKTLKPWSLQDERERKETRTDKNKS